MNILVGVLLMSYLGISTQFPVEDAKLNEEKRGPEREAPASYSSVKFVEKENETKTEAIAVPKAVTALQIADTKEEKILRDITRVLRSINGPTDLKSVDIIQEIVPAPGSTDGLHIIARRQIDYLGNEEYDVNILEESEPIFTPVYYSNFYGRKKLRPAPAFHG